MTLIAVIGAVLFIFQLGPFNTRPSAAAKIIPKVEKAVAQTQAAEVKAVEKAEVKTQTAAVAIEKRTATHVAQIRKSTASAVPADVPDDAFCRGVRASKLYAGVEAGCGYSSRP